MNKLYSIALLLLAFGTLEAQNQNTFQETLDPFTKLVVDPHINVELVKGDSEKIEVHYERVNPEEIFVEQSGRTLHVYLADAKIGLRLFSDHNFGEKKYRNAYVKMVITYKELKNIQFRGEEKLTCKGELYGRKITLKAYGETDVKIASVDARKLKVALFGENEFEVGAGYAMNQTINTYGENRVDATKLISYDVKTHSFGENKVAVNATESLSVLHLGEGEISYAGTPHMGRKWIIGEVDVRRSR